MYHNVYKVINIYETLLMKHKACVHCALPPSITSALEPIVSTSQLVTIKTFSPSLCFSAHTINNNLSSGVTRVQLKPGQLTNSTLITLRPMQFEFEIVTLLILADVIFIISKEDSWQLLLQLH